MDSDDEDVLMLFQSFNTRQVARNAKEPPKKEPTLKPKATDDTLSKRINDRLDQVEREKNNTRHTPSVVAGKPCDKNLAKRNKRIRIPNARIKLTNPTSNIKKLNEPQRRSKKRQPRREEDIRIQDRSGDPRLSQDTEGSGNEGESAEEGRESSPETEDKFQGVEEVFI